MHKVLGTDEVAAGDIDDRTVGEVAVRDGEALAVDEHDGRGAQAQGLDLAFMGADVDKIAQREGLVDDEHDRTKDVLDGVLRGEGEADDRTREQAEDCFRGLRVDDGDGLEAADEDDRNLDDGGNHRDEDIVQLVFGLIGDLFGPGDGDFHEIEDRGRMCERGQEGRAQGREVEPARVSEEGRVLLDDEKEGVGGEEGGQGFADCGHRGFGDGAVAEFRGDPPEGLLGEPADDEGEGNVP